MITSLEHDEVFVFGSNIHGSHSGGAARQAHEQFGAVWGIGAGITGQCYAIPTMEGIESLQKYIAQFLVVADLMPNLTFLMTLIGTGIAGYTAEEVAPLFRYAPENVILPEGWKVLSSIEEIK
jgi:hypothetical protein